MAEPERAGGCRLAMSEEVHDWLAGLCDSDPAQALTIGQALTALVTGGAELGAPLVVAVHPPGPDELLDALDTGYQEALEDLALRQAQVDAYRARKETLKATYTAARARLMVYQVLAASGDPAGDGTADGDGSADGDSRAEADTGTVSAAADPGVDAEAAAAADTMQEVSAKIRRELGYGALAEDLLELRPGALGGSDVRLLFAVEPPGTALLIAVLEGKDAARDHRREAVLLSAEVLQQVRQGQAPEASAHVFGDAESFLREFFPDRAEEARAGAVALLARIRAHTLAELRTKLGLTQAEVANRMGVPPQRVSAIEQAGPGATEVGTLADYVKALGGRLEITVDVRGERVRLR